MRRSGPELQPLGCATSNNTEVNECLWLTSLCEVKSPSREHEVNNNKDARTALGDYVTRTKKDTIKSRKAQSETCECESNIEGDKHLLECPMVGTRRCEWTDLLLSRPNDTAIKAVTFRTETNFH